MRASQRNRADCESNFPEMSSTSTSVFEAAIAVLLDQKRALSPLEICQIAIKTNIYRTQGKTPQNTFSSIITQHITKNPGTSPFCRVANGMYVHREFASSCALEQQQDDALTASVDRKRVRGPSLRSSVLSTQSLPSPATYTRKNSSPIRVSRKRGRPAAIRQQDSVNISTNQNKKLKKLCSGHIRSALCTHASKASYPDTFPPYFDHHHRHEDQTHVALQRRPGYPESAVVSCNRQLSSLVISTPLQRAGSTSPPSFVLHLKESDNVSATREDEARTSPAVQTATSLAEDLFPELTETAPAQWEDSCTPASDLDSIENIFSSPVPVEHVDTSVLRARLLSLTDTLPWDELLGSDECASAGHSLSVSFPSSVASSQPVSPILFGDNEPACSLWPEPTMECSQDDSLLFGNCVFRLDTSFLSDRDLEQPTGTEGNPSQ